MHLYLNESIISSDKIDNHWKAYELLKEIGKADQEVFILLSFNAGLKLLGKDIISMGGVTHCEAPINVLFRRALLHNATGIIIAHNHPAGSPEPSEEDRKLDEKIIQAGKVLEINVLDNLIITKEGHYAMSAGIFFKKGNTDGTS